MRRDRGSGPRREHGRRLRRPVRSVAFYGFLGSGNFGNDASFETVLHWFRTAYPDLQLSAITVAPEALQSRYGIPARSLSWRPSGRWTRVPGFSGRLGKALGRLVDVPRSLTLVGAADAVVVPGMGVLEATLSAPPWGLPWWMFMTALACSVRRRPFVLLDVGADPVPNPVTRWLYVATARLAAHISVRDEWSASALREAGLTRDVPVAQDVVFAYQLPPLSEPERHLLVTGVMAYYGPGNDPVAGRAVRDRYVATLASALAECTDAGDRIVFLGGDEVDAAVGRQIVDTIRRLRPHLADDVLTVRDVRTFGEVCAEMARAEVVIPSRFHNHIAAIRLGRPVVSLGYAEKNTRLMEAVGQGAYCQRIGEVDGAALLRQLAQVRASGPAVSAAIQAATAGYAEQVEALLRQVAEEVLGLPVVSPSAVTG